MGRLALAATAISKSILIAILLFSINAHAQKSPQTLRIMVLNPIYATDYPDLIADDQGMFAKRGIKAEFIPSVNPIVPLLSGDVDIVNVGSAAGMNVVIKQQDFQFIGVVSPPAGLALMVRPESPLASVAHKWPDSFAQLRGKTLGVTVSGAQVDLMAHWLANLSGLTPDKDITIQAAGDASTLVASLEGGRGSYDAAIVPSPLFEIVEQRKVGVSILDLYKNEGPKELADYPYATLAGRKSFIEKNSALIEKYLAAIQEAIDFAKQPENLAKITVIVAKALKAEPASLSQSMNTFVASIGNLKFSRKQWDTLIAMVTVNGMIKQEYRYEDNVFAGARVE
jgi:ABC-type nitrate/sulfonate/bicarbonate transport system substrate-binding protein